MEHLKYPVERRTIALDYDATASTNIPFWQNFVSSADRAGYDVYIVTARHPNRIEEPTMYFSHLVKGIIATSHMAKLHYCKQIGLRIDIFIDDSPWNIYCNIDGFVPQTKELNFLDPNYGSAIAEMIFPRNHPLKLRGYGFYYTGCYHEIPPVLQSFHRTKAGAYRAMRKFLTEGVEAHWERHVTGKRRNYPGARTKRNERWFGPFPHAKWSIEPATFELHE